MGNQQQPWMFAEDRFGRRMRKEREDRAMTQADVARVLEQEHDLKLHATAIAKMEQRDADRPRAIRLSEAKAIADMFGLTVDEMTSAAESEIQTLAREFTSLSAQTEVLQAQTAAAMEHLRSLMPVMSAPEEQLTPPIRAARNQILSSLTNLQGDHLERIQQGHKFISDLHRLKVNEFGFDYPPTDLADLRSLQMAGMTAVWIGVMHECYPTQSQFEMAKQAKVDTSKSTLQLASLLHPPNDATPTWAMAAVVAQGLWGHGAAVELQERIPAKMQGAQPNSIKFARLEVLNEMAREVQAELERIWPVAVQQYQKLESIWGDADALQQWLRESKEHDQRRAGEAKEDSTGA